MSKMIIFKKILSPSSNYAKIILNEHIPSCKNCFFYIPNTDYKDFTSKYSRCNKFGKKDIITDKITYDYVETSRNDSSKCGSEGKYFEKEYNLGYKMFKYNIFSDAYLYLLGIGIFSLFFVFSIDPRKGITYEEYIQNKNKNYRSLITPEFQSYYSNFWKR